MPRDLFGDIERPLVRVGTRGRYTVALSLAAHAAAVLLIVGATILGPVVLPGLASSDIIYTAAMLPPAPPPPPAPPAPREPAAPPPNPNAAPAAAPEGVAPEPARPVDPWPTSERAMGIVPGAGDLDTIVGAPPPPPPPAPQAPVPVGGRIRPPAKVRDVAPVYPPLALSARVQGLVIIEATIGVSGDVLAARVLRSIPLLDEAALAAVRQWRYTPTLLNGTPVPVVMTVTVNFQLR